MVYLPTNTIKIDHMWVDIPWVSPYKDPGAFSPIRTTHGSCHFQVKGRTQGGPLLVINGVMGP